MESSEATQILQQVGSGDKSAADRLLPLVYNDLRVLARSLFRGARSDHTLQPTALVHEAFVRLVDQSAVTWQDRTHFFAVSARAMRLILIDYARSKGAEKRGGNWNRVALEPAANDAGTDPIDLLALHDTLEELTLLNERHAQIVELRFFAGLTVPEVAKVLDTSTSSVEREWRVIRAWLSRSLQTTDGDE